MPAAGMLETFPARDGGECRWGARLFWAAVVLLGVLAFELTASAAFGIALACLKFGGEDFRSGFWLRQVDPNRARGRVCCWLFVASGLWKAGIAAGNALMLLLVLTFSLNKGMLIEQILYALLTLFVCFGLMTVTAYLGLAGAFRHRVRAWVRPELHEARRRRFAWPLASPARRPNQALRVIMTALILTPIGLCTGSCSRSPRLRRSEVYSTSFRL